MDEASQWLRLSQTDLTTAEQLPEDGIYYTAVFFAQQAAEKALKVASPQDIYDLASANVHIEASRSIVDWVIAGLAEEP